MSERTKMAESVLRKLGVKKVNSGACDGEWLKYNGELLPSYDPTTGKVLASVVQAGEKEHEMIVMHAAEAFLSWRMMPAPKRADITFAILHELMKYKKELGALVSLEMGKIRTEGEGEVQEMVDVARFVDGVSRQLYGLTMPSERAGHRLQEQWHPLGVVGIITAFNFPVAVWAWNAMIAAVCGDTMIWKPSSDTPLTAVAVQNIANRVMAANDLSGIFNLTIGKGSVVGEKLITDKRVPLISFTGSTNMGRHVAVACAKRLARPPILELGGNNAVIVLNDVKDDEVFDLALRGVLFGSVGTAGQRCTTTRRLIMQKNISASLTERLVKAYGQVKIGDPLAEGTLMGPLVNEGAVKDMIVAMEKIKEQGGEVLCGGKQIKGLFVEPTIIRARKDLPIMQEETFAPILYIVEANDLDEAIAINNDVPQGLSSSIFTTKLQAAEKFIGPEGSDCGIANVNVGTSGAEIGGAFGGEKETGSGRESGSDSWKQYMRRQTNTINRTSKLPLAQGIKFGENE